MAAKTPSNLLIRFATAIVGVPAILALLYIAPPWAFFLLTLSSGAVATGELLAMTHPEDRPSQAIGVVLSMVVACTLFFLGHDPRALVTLLGIPLLGPLVTLARLGDIRTAALRASAMAFAPLFIAVPMTFLPMIRRDVPHGSSYVVVALGFAWLADTGGYFAGRFLGRRKLYEAVSPKKTIEGALGGLVANVFGAILAHFWFLPSFPLSHGIPLAIVAGMLGQAGDLGESLLKRSTGVKDSGAIIPGHGGLFDRIDALILTSTAVYLYTIWIDASAL